MSLLSRIAVEAARGFGMLARTGSPTNVSASYLSVAGGGGGGCSNGGGGGAGGYRESTATLSTLNTYSIAVGAGGAGASTRSIDGSNGVDSYISGTGLTTITSTGGGGGGSDTSPATFNGKAGGSGGGGVGNVSSTGGAGNTPSTSPSQGSNGGAGANAAPNYGGGGGGGASAVGVAGTSIKGGNGGAGTASSISGSSVTYAGGGGAGSFVGTAGTGGAGGGGNGNSSGAGTAGTANLGGGGGGGSNASGVGGQGGSGIVIISYTSATPKFVGGTLTTSGGNQIHTFTSSGTLSPLTPVTASYLVVAGGGGGGGYVGAGGGGAGGLLTSSTTLYSGASYVVTVGAGGVGGVNATPVATSGSNSSLSGTGLTTITSTGGGYGGGYNGSHILGAAGGSGGGNNYNNTPAGGTGTSGQGNAGGGGSANGLTYAGGGGGGGASAVGGNSNTVSGSPAGNGGTGTASSISGSSVTYAGGGGAGVYPAGGTAGTATGGGGAGGVSPNGGTSGTTNTGGGGGGSGGLTTAGGAGGSGVVIISYAGSQVFNGGLVTSSGGNTIHTFNATGALTPLTNNLNNSLRFRASASAYLSRTPTVAGSKTTWTWSGWVKRGTISATSSIFSAGSGANITELFFTAGNILRFYDYISSSYATNLETTQVFRDPSAWYHITVVYDTTQATAANRVRLYVNGNQVTSFGSTTYPAQNYASGIMNSTTASAIGGNAGTGYFDGYLTDINFIDSQALEPYYFGNNDAYGNWKPIKYTGMYGTNGYYLTFGNTTSTTTLGYDSSPNGNNWTTNNISLTAGVTYDAMTDVPTNTSATVGNYCVNNPVDTSLAGGVNAITISGANLNLAGASSDWAACRATIGVTSGKWYWECTRTGASNLIFGIGLNNTTLVNAYSSTSYGYFSTGDKYSNNVSSAYGASFTSGDVIGVAFDADAGTLTFYKNNVSQGTAYTGLTSGPYFPLNQVYTTGSTASINFGQRPFSYTPPTGYVALNTYNLPTPTILQGNKYMDATLYTGTEVNGTVIVNQGQFYPDLVWIKTRSTTAQHVLTDSVRGVTKQLFSSLTNAEQTSSTGITSLNSNGFTLGTNVNPTGSTNGGGNTLVGWQWQAGQGSTSSNTSGSITSTTSVNTTAGFSVVTYVGSGSTSTIGHGLGVAPKMIITKNRSSGAYNWGVYHASAGNTVYGQLNTTAAFSTLAIWQNTTPTSSIFYVGNYNAANQSADNYVAYCFSEITGFSKFGIYTGNGSSDGPFIYLGFRPKFIMIKRTDSTSNWFMESAPIPGYNQSNLELYAESNSAEGSTTGGGYDFLSNGFKVRIGSAYNPNVSGGTYIYAAWAENPFKNSNAR